MKRVSKCGLIVGFLIGTVAASVFWISRLPGAPSQYGPRFPITKDPLPTNALSGVGSETVGFDVYTNVKPRRTLKQALPYKHSHGQYQRNGMDVFISATPLD